MAFTNYSQVVNPVEWKPPVSEDLLLKGALFTDKNIQDNTQKANDIVNQLYSIPSLPGEDTKKKQEIIDGVLQQVSKISHNDFRNPSTLNQLKGYISQVTSNPDFMGIAERGTVTEIEAKKQADALAKGKTYYSPILNQAEKYTNQGLYIRDTKFNGQGFLDPEIGKRLTEEIGKLKKIKSFDPKTGRVDEFYDPNEISLITNNMMSDPNVRALKDYEFEEQFADRDWGTEGLQDATEKLNALSASKNEALQILNRDPNNVIAKQVLYEVEGYISKYSSAINNPGVNGEMLKSLRKEEFMNDFKEDLMNIQNSHSFGGFDMSKQEEMYRQLQNQKALIATQQAKEIAVHVANNKSDYEYLKTAVDEGYQIVKGTDGSITMSKPEVLQPVETAITNVLAGADLSESQKGVIKTLLEDNRGTLFGTDLADKDLVNMTFGTDPKTKLRYVKSEVEEPFQKNDYESVYFIKDKEDHDKLAVGSYYIETATGKIRKKGEKGSDGIIY
jgi:hypothetical protein